jgi:hypothetical protein
LIKKTNEENTFDAQQVTTRPMLPGYSDPNIDNEAYDTSKPETVSAFEPVRENFQGPEDLKVSKK